MPHTIELTDFDTTVARDQAAINQVTEMRDQIERKEAEVARLREQLERDNEVDMSKAPEELKRLQAAFDQVQKICAAKLAPIEEKLRKCQAKCEAKEHYCAQMSAIANERVSALTDLNAQTDRTTAALDDPAVHPIDECGLKPLISEGVKVQSDVGSVQRNASLDGYSEKQMAKLNEDLRRALADAIDLEEKAKRRVATAQKDIEVRCARPKVVTIDDEWVRETKKMNMTSLLLQEANNAIRLFNDEVARIANENRSHNEQVARLREELIALERYIPGGNNDTSKNDARSEMTIKAANDDFLKQKLMVAKNKLKVARSRLASLQNKLNEQPAVLEDRKRALEQAKGLRVQADDALEETQTVRSDLVSQREFMEDQREILRQRITAQREQLKEIKENTKKLKLIYRKQQMVISLNEEMMALKKTNLGRVAGIVSNLLKINSEIENDEQ